MLRIHSNSQKGSRLSKFQGTGNRAFLDDEKSGFDIGIKAAVWAVEAYRIFVSPLFPNSCRFTPTCSEYAILAFKKYGLFKGGFCASKRILRCNPFCAGGYDPLD
ncbi:membrane protein insertion efficiency factor YidD [candidate division WOR-3 bacterium]|nr:membrane protein insertion efficiency factor YidD [candidate division WOR-3 bacterium]